jgi:hypothetical protein
VQPETLPVAPPPRPLDRLRADEVVRVVVERNPTLEEMRATAAAVAARYPQAVSLDDPMFGFRTPPVRSGRRTRITRHSWK